MTPRRDAIPRPDDCGVDAAPYLLGALEPEQARAFASHLKACAVCRDEVAALQPVIAALPDAAPARPVPRALRRRVLRTVRAEPKPAPSTSLTANRRRGPTASRTGWLALGLAVTVAAVVVHVGTNPPTEHIIPATVGRAELRMAGGHGELVVDRLPPLPAHETYELWLVGGTRKPVPSTLFGVASGGVADLGVPGDVRGLTRLLVTVEPRGGSLAPTTRAVIQVPLAHVQRS